MCPLRDHEIIMSKRMVQCFLNRTRQDKIWLAPFFIHMFLPDSAAIQTAHIHILVTHTNVDPFSFLEAISPLPSDGVSMLI